MVRAMADDNTVFRQFHHRIKWLWLYMELGTLVTGLVVAWRYKYLFLIMLIAVTLWYISMDAVMLIIDHEDLWNSYVAIPSTCVDVLWRVDVAISVLWTSDAKHSRLRVLALSFRRFSVLGRPYQPRFRQRTV